RITELTARRKITPFHAFRVRLGGRGAKTPTPLPPVFQDASMNHSPDSQHLSVNGERTRRGLTTNNLTSRAGANPELTVRQPQHFLWFKIERPEFVDFDGMRTHLRQQRGGSNR